MDKIDEYGEEPGGVHALRLMIAPYALRPAPYALRLRIPCIRHLLARESGETLIFLPCITSSAFDKVWE